MMAANALKYTDCMRSHGEPDFPDPNSQGMIKINVTGIMGPNSPEFQRRRRPARPLNNGGFDEEMRQGSPEPDSCYRSAAFQAPGRRRTTLRLLSAIPSRTPVFVPTIAWTPVPGWDSFDRC